jgi:hypothetical protein
MSWQQTFFDPIELPNGRKLLTLRDAALYITKLPKAEQQAPEWRTATELLILIAENGGDAMMAHIAMMRALQRRGLKMPRAETAPRRKRAKQFRIIK